MKIFMYTFAAFVTLATLAHADTQTDRASLIGTWVQSGVQNSGTNKWVIESQSDGLHITQIEGSAPVAEFSCATDGHNCDVRISGHKATVSMYYNGSALVQLVTKGDVIVKRRFSVEPSGNSMKVQMTPMTGKTVTAEELEFERSQPAARK